MKKPIHMLLATVLAASAGITGCADKNGTKEESKPLVAAMELAYPPFETKDAQGNPTGVSVDFMKAFGESIG